MADPAKATRRLDQPTERRVKFEIDPEAFGRFSENLARFMGTGRFLAGQTVLVITWIVLNLVAINLRWDPYPFILLNLAFSTQAAYAAPLILLAQNRQDDRDRISLEEDRQRAAQTKADTEYLARELASLRILLGEVATRDYLRGEIERVSQQVENLTNALHTAGVTAAPAPKPQPKNRSKDRSKDKKSRTDDPLADGR